MYGQLLFLLSIAVCCSAVPIELPDSQLSALTSGGTPVLQEAITADNEALEVALEAFDPVNETCQAIAATAGEECQSCIENKCNSHGEDVCGTFCSDMYFFFTDDIPFFFEDTIPNAFVNLGDEIVDLGESSWDVLVDFNNLIDDELGIDIGGIAVDIGKGFDVAGDFIVNDIYSPVEDFFVDTGKWFGGIFKKRQGPRMHLKKRSHLVKRHATKPKKRQTSSVDRPTTKPSCDNLKDDAGYWCLYFYDPSHCSDCGFDADARCPGWTKAVADVQDALDNRGWLSGATNQNYAVTKVVYDTSGFDATGRVANCEVEVHMFGHDYAFTVVEPMNLFDATTSGALIAEYAIDAAAAVDWNTQA